MAGIFYYNAIPAVVEGVDDEEASLSSNNLPGLEIRGTRPLLCAGLVNLTNTCYLHSILQCLKNTREF